VQQFFDVVGDGPIEEYLHEEGVALGEVGGIVVRLNAE
jgi:hypothetical protein